MDKMTHVKFNLNNFLFALSDAIDNTSNRSKNSSKRVSYIALKIAKLNMIDEDIISDLLSYCLICDNQYLLKSTTQIPFNKQENILHEDFINIVKIAQFVNDSIKIDTFITNKTKVIQALEDDETLDEIYKENLLYLMEFEYFWLDLSNDESLSFKILDMINDFTIEYSYEGLSQLSKLFYELYYQYTNNTYTQEIGIKAIKAANFYNFDQKDSARFQIASYLSYLGFLVLQKELTDNKASSYFTKEIISKMFGFDDIAKLASSVDENIDGSGYPYKLAGNELSLKFRILTMIYRYQNLEDTQKYNKDEIINILDKEAQKGLLDKSVLKDIDALMHS